MERIRRGWRELRKNRRRGVSLIVALCASALLLGLALSLIYSASLLMARANRKIGEERCYQLASSFAGVLNTELRTYTTDRSDVGAAADKIAPSDSFFHYTNEVLEQRDAEGQDIYIEFDADDPLNSSYYYTTGQDDDDYGKVTVRLRKQNPDAQSDPALAGDSFPYEQSSTRTTEIEQAAFIRYQIEVAVTDTLDGDSYTYATEYYRKDRFLPRYTWNGTESGTQTVYWNGSGWYTDSGFTTPIAPSDREDADGTVHTDVVTIEYEYDTSKAAFMTYEPTYVENWSGGDGSETTP